MTSFIKEKKINKGVKGRNQEKKKTLVDG